ncbi:MAG: GAF domain-containing protein [Planctomycetes bacterium]|nr:GAF domain-containing protein [Planctomycetota bacterium]
MGPNHREPSSGLLATLDEITELAGKGGDFVKLLTNVACLVGNRFHTDVCSLYLLEGDELLLAATVGLFQDSVGRVRMRLDEGLVGLVGEQLEPVMVADEAASHPRFKYFPDAGEDPYHSFLGVPILSGRALAGVLVVQSREPRDYTPDEVRMLSIVGRHLGPVVSERGA